MNKSLRRALVSIGALVLAVSASLIAISPASATPPPKPSPAGGTITICPGTQVSLNDVTTGAVLPLQTQADMIEHFQWKCAHPSAGSHGSTATLAGTRTVIPNKVIAEGDLTAHLVITVGSVTWWTTASSMSTGTYRTLECTSRVNNGAWGNCGTADGSGSSLSTRTNSYCPPKGQEFEVEAWLIVGSAQYWDDAWGVTK